MYLLSLAELENTSTVQRDDQLMEMKRNVEGKDNRIIEVESRYFHVTCDKKIELMDYTQTVTLNTRQESLAT